MFSLHNQILGKMKINLKRINENFKMEATNENGNSIIMDGSESIGGENLGARPMQVVLMALAGCTSIDVLSVLRKKRQAVDDFEIEVTAEREEDKVPSLFTNIHVKYKLKGDLDPEKVKRAIQLSEDKYCSVHKIIEKTANITWSFTINED